ncbi:MAG: hypothetical protein IPJ65_02645 [Archangiaceae bacterium]|nr:hypothetical protein [Archangiaceae bacterium]
MLSLAGEPAPTPAPADVLEPLAAPPQSRAEQTAAFSDALARFDFTAYVALKALISPEVTVKPSTFARLSVAALAEPELSQLQLEMICDAFSRLPEIARLAALERLSQHTEFDRHALEHLLGPGEHAPFSAFAPYLTEEFVRGALPARLAYGDLEELGALYLRLCELDRRRVLTALAAISPSQSQRFASRVKASQKHSQSGFFRRLLEVLALTRQLV